MQTLNLEKLSKKRRIPRKLKKKWLKMGIRLVVKADIDQEWVDKWNRLAKEASKQPLILKDG